MPLGEEFSQDHFDAGLPFGLQNQEMLAIGDFAKVVNGVSRLRH